ncbi:MAG: cell wall-active antibiotics response protein LiaF [Chloroflexota bacterium]|nr:cell wall-active antibiotics response protein LiaF [Chloroflexota bacterium]
MKRWQIILGITLVVLGLFSLIEVFFVFNPWRFFGPLILIGLGILLILRPRIAGQNVKVQMPILGDVRKRGFWEATQHEIWWIVGTSWLDFTDAVFPTGDALIRIFGFVTDVKITLPEDVGLQINSTAIVSELKGFERKEEWILNSLEYQTPNYISAEKRVTVQTVGFVSEVRVKSSLM